MEIKLYLGKESYVRHDEIITLPVDSIILDLTSGAFALGEKIVTVITADGEKQYRYGKPIDITEHFTEPGEVKITVSLIVRGEVATVWQIEPFCVKKIPSGLIAIPEITELKERVTTLERAVIETANLID